MVEAFDARNLRHAGPERAKPLPADSGGSYVACDGEGPNTDLWPNPVDPIPAPLEIPDMVDDFVPLYTLDIDCTDPQGWKAGANCIASSPRGEHVAEVQTAFDRIEQRGDSCASIASHG